VSSIELREWRGAELDAWDPFIRSSFNGTLFHERAFLAYHGRRFEESERFLVFAEKGKPLAALALGIVEEDGRRVARSPYGASYGGVVFHGPLTYERSRAIAEMLIAFLREADVTSLILTAPHALLATAPLDTFQFALLEAGFVTLARDVVSAALLGGPASSEVSERARRSARKAEQSGVSVRFQAPVGDFWRTVESTFAKHGSPPTHSREEFAWLIDRLPGRVQTAVAYADGEPVAGLGEFRLNERVQSSFYICQDPARQELQALSLLLVKALDRARQDGCQVYDFGTSTVGMQARPNVWAFKENFTRVGVFRETLGWEG
jgi:Acetyltransferase (GNAT) domain